MAIFIDLLFVAALLFFTIKYGISGLMQAVLGIGKFIAAIIVAVILGKPLAIWISDTFISDWLSGIVYEKISANLMTGESLSNFFNNIPEWFVTLAKLFGKDIAALQASYSTEQASNEIIRDMAYDISCPLADMISAVIAYVLVFVTILIILTIVIKAIGKIKIPLLTSIDKFLGACLGFIIGLCSVSLAASALYVILEFLTAFNQNPDIMNVYSDSYVFKFIFEIRIFDFIRTLI